MYSAKGHEFTLKIRSHVDNNKLDQKEEHNFRNHDFFEDILKNFNRIKFLH